MKKKVSGGLVVAIIVSLTLLPNAIGGSKNCKPAWKCASPSPTVTVRPTVSPTITPTPTPQPTLQPTPTPTITPTPTPFITPTPTQAPNRPFDPPVTVRTINVSPTDDPVAVVAAAPDGSIINFPGGTFELTKGLLLSGKSNIVLKGNGTTLRFTGRGSDEALSAFLLRGSNHVSIDNFIVDGGDPGPITSSRGENAHVLGLSGWYGGLESSYVEISNVRASNVFGDFAYLEGRNVLPRTPSHHVWIHDNIGTDFARNGISLINVTDVLIERNNLTRVSYHMIDFEPNFLAEQVHRVTIRNNQFGSYAHRQNLLGFFVADWSPTGALVRDITITGNSVVGIAANGYNGTPRALDSKFISNGGPRHAQIIFTNNTTTRTRDATWGSGGVLYFSGIDGVTVTGNVQPLTGSGVLTRFDNCTNVVT